MLSQNDSKLQRLPLSHVLLEYNVPTNSSANASDLSKPRVMACDFFFPPPDESGHGEQIVFALPQRRGSSAARVRAWWGEPWGGRLRVSCTFWSVSH